MCSKRAYRGIYFGERGTKDTPNGKSAYDIEVRRITKIAFDMTMKRNRKVTSADKSNVLKSSKLWRKVVIEVSKDYPEVELNHMCVDNASMQVIRNPRQFDVILTNNMFGDILSDEISIMLRLQNVEVFIENVKVRKSKTGYK